MTRDLSRSADRAAADPGAAWNNAGHDRIRHRYPAAPGVAPAGVWASPRSGPHLEPDPDQRIMNRFARSSRCNGYEDADLAAKRSERSPAGATVAPTADPGQALAFFAPEVRGCAHGLQ
ncbi:hypothetical protein Ais01nite_61310 [Asanoa ishikariensis]|nr:hypothetical protein Ais01nite_61310 [Asanoa ishikariensis]